MIGATLPNADLSQSNGTRYKETLLWWQNIAAYCDIFFEALHSLKAEHSTHELSELLIALALASRAAESVPYPLLVKDERRLLLLALSNIQRGFVAALAGKIAVSSRRITEAQTQLHTLYIHLNQARVL